MGLFGGRRFGEAADEFLERELIYTESRRTISSNVRILKRHFESMRLAEIGKKEIEAFISGRIRQGVGKPTINRNRAALSKFFEWAITQGCYQGANPVRLVKKFRESSGRTRYLTSDEYSRLLLAAAPHLKRIIVVAVHSGGRLNEILRLRWGDIDLERGLLYFRRETTKGRKERQIPINDELAAMLRSLRPGPPTEPVFDYAGRPLKGVRTAFESARLKAGIPDVHFHDLRHTFASWFAQNGGDERRLQKYLGHSSSALTQRYTHLSPEYLTDGVRFIGPPKVRRSEDGSA